MEKTKRDFCGKALLMLGLAGAVLGVARAGYDVGDTGDTALTDGDLIAQDFRSRNETAATKQAHAELLLATLSEEFTEIHALAAQQMKFRQMGDEESTEIARMYGRWIREHKAGLPMLARLIRLHGADPATAEELKAPVLGTKMEMLQAIHNDHVAAVRSSQMRFAATSEWAIQWAMHKRANLARKHLAEMAPYLDRMQM
jgi:hypothetical protein